MEFEYKEIYKYPIDVCLNITDNCNLACKYCFVQQKPHFITLDMAKKAMDWLISNLEKRKKLGKKDEQVNINFFGGEPTLLYEEIIVPLVLYGEETYPNQVKFGITTNGTLLNEERIDFFTKHKVHLLLSIDGAKETQDFNRPQRNGKGSFDLVEKNIPYLLKNKPNTTFRATLYQPTVKNLFENYMYAQKKGFKYIFFCPNAREKWTQEHIQEMKEQLDKIFIDRIIKYSMGQEPLKFSVLDKIYKKILEHDLQVYANNFQKRDRHRGVVRCGLGTGSASISYKGLIFACQEQDSRDTGDYFYIGDIFNGVNVEKHTKILKDYYESKELVSENKDLCENCLLYSTCHQDMCPSVSHDLFNTFFIRPEIDCIFYEYIMKKCVQEMQILVKETKNELFKKYLDNLFNEYKEG